MLVRLMAGGRLALPRALLESFPGVDCFNATVDDGQLVVSSARSSRAELLLFLGARRWFHRNILVDYGTDECAMADN